MQARGPTSNSQSEEQPLFFLNPEPNSLAAAIKSAATELTRAKTQARISQQPKSIFIKNDYRDAQILFLYDFYKESDIDNIKIFIEGLYGAIEQIISRLHQMTIPVAKNLPIKTENKGYNPEDRAKGQISLPVETISTFDASSTQLQDIEMNILLAIKSLIEVNQNFKKYFTDQKKLVDETEFDMSERVKFNDDNKAGRRVLLSIHPVFESLEKSLRLLQDLLRAQKASQETHHTQINRRNKTEEAHALRGDAEISIYTSVETFAQKQGLSPREPIPETATKSMNTELNTTGLENDTKSISDLLKKIVGHLTKRDQINTEFSNEGGFFMDKKTFRLLTEIEREMKMESWLLRTLEANSRKDSLPNKRDQELEELKMRNSLISDDLQYKTQLLSAKLHEMSELATETERLRADNSRLLQFINLQKEHTHGKARWAYEKDLGAKEALEKARLRANSLEKQIDNLKSEIKQREGALAQLNEQNQAIRESKEQQKDQLRLQLQALEKHLRDGQSTRDDLQRKNTKLESELDTLVRENSRLTTEARELRNEMKSIYDLKIHMDKVSHQKEAPKERSQAANVTEPDYKLRYEQLMIDYDRLKKILDQQKSVDRFQDKEKEQLSAKVEVLSNENKVLKKEINTSIVSYEKQLRELRVENEELQSKLSELRSKSQNLRRTHISLEDELRKSHSDVINLSNDQIDLAERFKKARFSPQRSPPTKSLIDVYRTPERRNHISPDSRYENSQSRSGSPGYGKYAKIRDNLNSGTPSKALRPLNQNVSFRLISPKNISELGIRKPPQKEREWPAKDLKSSKSDQKFSLIEKIKPLPPGKSQLKDQSHSFYNDDQNELEDELKLFYSVSKIIDDSLSEQNSFARSPHRKRDSPEKTRMISKTLTDVNSKLEDLKDNLPARKVWRAINEVEEQCDDLSVDDIRSRSFVEEPRRQIQKRKMNLPTRKSNEDAYSIITMQSNLIKKLLKNIK